MKSQRYGRSHPRSGFTPEEDCLLIDLVAQYGSDCWATIASYMEKRNARQCKDRYTSYLSPTINNGPYTEEEDDLLRTKYLELGPKWVKISKFFPNRTDISVKCRWAVLNRRDMKKKGNNINSTQSNNIKKISSDNDSENNNFDYTSSSPSDQDPKENYNPDATFTLGKHKNNKSSSYKKKNSTDSRLRSRGSTMSIRNRSKKHVDYYEDNFLDNDEIIEQKISETNKHTKPIFTSNDPNSSYQITPPSSLSSNDNLSLTNLPTPKLEFPSQKINMNITPTLPVNSLPTFISNNISQNQIANSNSAAHPSISSASLDSMKSYDNLFGFNKLNEELFVENHSSSFFPAKETSQMMTQKNYNNCYSFPSFDNNTNLRTNDKIFESEFSWDFFWDYTVGDMKDSQASINLF